jgi:hypothetical protein
MTKLRLESPMKKLNSVHGLALAVLLLGALDAPAQPQSSIYFNMRERTGSAGNRLITVTPLDGVTGFYGTNQVYGGPFTVQPSNGAVSFPLYVGNYRFTYDGLPTAQTVFWPADPSITNAADPSIQRDGLTLFFGLLNALAAGTNITITTNAGKTMMTISLPAVVANFAGTNTTKLYASATEGIDLTAAYGTWSFRAFPSAHFALTNSAYNTIWEFGGGLNMGSSIAQENLKLGSDGTIAANGIPLTTSVMPLMGTNFNGSQLAMSFNGGGLSNVTASTVAAGATIGASDANSLTNLTTKPWNPDNIFTRRARNVDNVLYYRTNNLNVLYFGDTGSALGGLWYESLYNSLNPFLDKHGFALGDNAAAVGNYGYVTGSGTVTVMTGDTQNFWPGTIYGLGNGASLTWASSVVTAGYPANQVGLIWVSQAGFGTIALQTNRSGGSYGTCLTIDGTAGNATNFALPRAADYGFKIVSTGTNIIVGPVIRDTTGPGWTICNATCQGNIDVFTRWASTTDTNLFYRAMQLLAPDLIIWESNDTAQSVTNNFDALEARWAAACTNADVVYVTTNPNLTNFSNTVGDPVAKAQADAMTYYAKLYNRMAYDGRFYFSPTNYAFSNALYLYYTAGDPTHPSAKGGFMSTKSLPGFIGLAPSDMVTRGFTYKARGMSFVNSTETNNLGVGMVSSPIRFGVRDTSQGGTADVGIGDFYINYGGIQFAPGAASLNNPSVFGTGANGVLYVNGGSGSGTYLTVANNMALRVWPSRGVEIGNYGATDPGANNLLLSSGNVTVIGNFQQASNALSAWPTAPATRGGFAIVSSNGYPWILLSTNGGIGSTSWTATNKFGW